MRSVKEKKVFDTQASGPNAWFEERVAQYYNVLQDFCLTVGTAPKLDHPAWFSTSWTSQLEIQALA